MPTGDSDNTDLYLCFSTVQDDTCVNNIELNVAPLKCGSVIDENGLPKPSITCDSDAKYRVLGTYWIKDGGSEEPYDNADDFTIHGGDKYGVLAYINPRSGYNFYSNSLHITFNDGEKDYDGSVFRQTMAPDMGAGYQDVLLEVGGWILANHIPGETTQNIIEPTCTESGSCETIANCESCGDEMIIKTETTDATGHDWGDWEEWWNEGKLVLIKTKASLKTELVKLI